MSRLIIEMKSDIVNSSLFEFREVVRYCDWVHWQKNATFVESLLNFDNGYCVKILHLDSGLGSSLKIPTFQL